MKLMTIFIVSALFNVPAFSHAEAPERPFPYLSNGIFAVSADSNGYPTVTKLSVLGTTIVPFDNAGAGFQMAARSSLGNAYNPTQAGDCTGAASQLVGVNNAWAGAGLGMSASNGFQLAVQPRNYNEPSSCLGTGALLPYQFTFGLTPGDGNSLAKEVLVVDMSITRELGSQVVDLAQTELPSIFPLSSVVPFAYWSSNGTTFHPFTYNGTNDIRRWPYTQNFYVQGEAVMLCTPQSTFCLALYSNETTNMYISHRRGATTDLGLLSLIAGVNGTISDYQTHSARKLLVVGTPSTVSSAISQARLRITDWGDL
jgi:hypothetical protein